MLGHEDDIPGRAAAQVNRPAGFDAPTFHQLYQFRARPAAIPWCAKIAVANAVQKTLHAHSAFTILSTIFVLL
ncbi:MAG: hypothetical protein WBG94_00020, partial [Anaerolineales bacterium]